MYAVLCTCPVTNRMQAQHALVVAAVCIVHMHVLPNTTVHCMQRGGGPTLDANMFATVTTNTTSRALTLTVPGDD
jgi:hypothetical protein